MGIVLRLKRRINYKELHPLALDLISEDQKSYIDEFSFFVYPSSSWDNEKYEAWYGGELLAVWNGAGWQNPKEL